MCRCRSTSTQVWSCPSPRPFPHTSLSGTRCKSSNYCSTRWCSPSSISPIAPSHLTQRCQCIVAELSRAVVHISRTKELSTEDIVCFCLSAHDVIHALVRVPLTRGIRCAVPAGIGEHTHTRPITHALNWMRYSAGIPKRSCPESLAVASESTTALKNIYPQHTIHSTSTALSELQLFATTHFTSAYSRLQLLNQADTQ